MKVFLSYSTVEEQIMALRLQTLGAVYDLTVFVPPAGTRRTTSAELSKVVRDNIDNCDVVLGVMMQNPVAGAVSELSYALAKGKLVIPIVGPGVDVGVYQGFEHFQLDPGDPSRTELAILGHLTNKKTSAEKKNVVLALASIAIGLALFWNPKCGCDGRTRRLGAI